jgi:hypothetical protein
VVAAAPTKGVRKNSGRNDCSDCKGAAAAATTPVLATAGAASTLVHAQLAGSLGPGCLRLDRLDLGRLDLGRLDLGRLDLDRLDLDRLDLDRLDLDRQDLGRLDLDRLGAGRQGVGARNLGRGRELAARRCFRPQAWRHRRRLGPRKDRSDPWNRKSAFRTFQRIFRLSRTGSTTLRHRTVSISAPDCAAKVSCRPGIHQAAPTAFLQSYLRIYRTRSLPPAHRYGWSWLR